MRTYTITATARCNWSATRTVEAKNKTEARKMVYNDMFMEAVRAVSALAFKTFTVERADTPAPAAEAAPAAPVAEFSQHAATCSCGLNHSLMTGQVGITCKCGAEYDRPELGLNETRTITSR